jgi:hypothetical protein
MGIEVDVAFFWMASKGNEIFSQKSFFFFPDFFFINRQYYLKKIYIKILKFFFCHWKNYWLEVRAKDEVTSMDSQAVEFEGYLGGIT